MLGTIILGRQYVPLIHYIHTLIDTTLVVPRSLNPSLIMTFITLVFAITDNSLLTLRFQISRILLIRTRQLNLQLVEKVIIIREQAFGFLVVDDFARVRIQYIICISYLYVGLRVHLIIIDWMLYERCLLEIFFDVVHRDILQILLLLLLKLLCSYLSLDQIPSGKILTCVGFHLQLVV